MGEKIRRNDPCHCGSGKKYKVCHEADSKKSNYPLILGIVFVFGIIFYFFFENGRPMISNELSPLKSQDNLKLNTKLNPPGKVWSPEHNHWHDAPNAQPFSTSNSKSLENTTPPPGTPPPGKVWSPEHNHWHDKK
tara:strand:+ start:243 stop:647 length:405 start_codon:yes stop_codon:yes gene_type:complete